MGWPCDTVVANRWKQNPLGGSSGKAEVIAGGAATILRPKDESRKLGEIWVLNNILGLLHQLGTAYFRTCYWATNSCVKSTWSHLQFLAAECNPECKTFYHMDVS